jgi:hypothetical protein
MARSARLRGERLPIMLDPEELTAADDFRFTKRMPSMASAVRELLKRGLAAEGFAGRGLAGAQISDRGPLRGLGVPPFELAHALSEFLEASPGHQRNGSNCTSDSGRSFNVHSRSNSCTCTSRAPVLVSICIAHRSAS